MKPSISQPKRQHFVPAFLLQNFTDDNNKLYCFDMRSGKAYQTSPVKGFVEQDLYTRTTGNEKDYDIEKQIARVEGEASNVIRRILEAAQVREIPRLSSTERRAIDKFIVIQWRRPPEHKAHSLHRDQGIVSETIQDVARIFGEEIVRSAVDRLGGERAMHENAWATAQLFDIPPWIKDKGLAVVVSPDVRRATYIAGSTNVILAGNDREGPQGEVMMPISSEVAISLASLKQQEELIIDMSRRGIRLLNRCIFQNSHVVCASSERLIAKFARQWGRQCKRVVHMDSR